MKITNSIKIDTDLFKRHTFLNFILAGILAFLIVSIIILSAVPPVSRDALTHHLAVPKLYLKHGGIYEIPSVQFSYYPMNLDLLYLVPLYFGNDIIPKYIHFMFALLTAGLIYGYLKKRLSPGWGLLGALVYLSLPVIVKLSITVYVDLGLVFFSTASMLSIAKWVENGFKVKFLLLAALCCGLALGVKYNGLIVLFILALFVPYLYIAETKKLSVEQTPVNNRDAFHHQLKAIGYGAIFFLVAVVVFSPWMLRNYAWKGNPIYPLYHSFFSQRAVSPQAAQTAIEKKSSLPQANHVQNKSSSRWGPLAIRKVIYDESWWEIALIPLRVFFQGRDDSPKHFDGKLSPFLFLLPLFAFFQIKRDSATLRIEKKIFAVFIVLYLLYAFLQIDMRIRYIAPIIAPAVILSIFGLHHIASAFSSRWKKSSSWLATGFIVLLASGLLAYNGIYIFQQFKYVKPFSYLRGQVSRDEYIAQYRPENVVIQKINQNLPESTKILALFLGNRGYYCNRELIFGDNLFKKIIKNGQTPDMIGEKLRKMDFTHLLIRYDLFNTWANKQFNEQEKEMLKEFLGKQLFQLYSHAGYGLFQFNSYGSTDDGTK